MTSPIPPRLLQHLRERKLGQWAVAYVAGAWAVLQGLDFLVDHFGWTSGAVRVSAVALIAGLVVTLVLAWYHGERGAQHVSGAELLILAAVFLTGGAAVASVSVRSTSEAVTEGEATGARELDARRVAVLPLRNATRNDPEGDMLAAGMHQDLLTRLARIRDLDVVSRTSVMEYGATTKNIRTIARELGAGAILEGGVQRAGGTMRVTMQLIDASSDRYLWAETFDRAWSLDNLFAIQSEIAEQVAYALEATLSAAERASLASQPTDNEEAFALYTQASSLWITEQEDDAVRRTVELARAATTRDPRFVEAFALSGLAQSVLYWYQADRSDARLRSARAAIDSALTLDPRHPDARTALGYWYYWGFLDYDRAVRELERALAVSPSSAEALMGIAAIRRRQGRVEEALGYFERARTLDSRSAVRTSNVGETLDLLRRYDEAEPYFARAVALAPTSALVRLDAARHSIARGQLADARGHADVAERLSADDQVAALQARIDLLERDPRSALVRLAQLQGNAAWAHAQFQFLPPSLVAGDAYRMLGLEDSATAAYADAARMLETHLRGRPDDERAWSALGIARASLGRTDGALAAARRATELLPLEREAWRGAFRIWELARVYTLLGDFPRALDILEQLTRLPTGMLVSPALLRLDPAWDPLRSEPRFQALLRT